MKITKPLAVLGSLGREREGGGGVVTHGRYSGVGVSTRTRHVYRKGLKAGCQGEAIAHARASRRYPPPIEVHRPGRTTAARAQSVTAGRRRKL